MSSSNNGMGSATSNNYIDAFFGGNDMLGGAGDDTINARADNDILIGGTGDDILFVAKMGMMHAANDAVFEMRRVG